MLVVTQIVLLLTTLLAVSHAYSHYRYRIPNGEHVIHPCFEANVLWYGVGHKNPQGGGERNEFGEDFASQGYRWTRCLCEMDSDGDGLTNGKELGDPDCMWEMGKSPSKTTGITHPGVCTPFNDTECADKADFVVCTDPTVFDCPATEANDVETMTLAFPETSIEPVDTVYKCMAFELPQDGDYHLIASSPNIDNDIVMHHIVVYGCRGTEQEESALSLYSEPTDCGMTECNNFVTGWTLGIQGQCFDDEYGVRFGPNGYRVVVMEFHWNNPELKSSYTDASSLELYYTANKRTYDAGVFLIGPALLMIPPGFASYDVVGTCSGECLGSLFTETWYLAEVIPHMHYLGSGLKLEVIHNGVARTVYDQPQYYYDNPEIYKYEEDVAIEPGDELRVTCTYTSKNKEGFTYFGEATADEMCYAIIVYYPYVATESTTCSMTNNYGYCPNGNFTDISEVCDFDDLLGNSVTYGEDIYRRCDGSGVDCLTGCTEAIEPLLTHPCLTSDAGPLITSWMSYDYLDFVQMLVSCDDKPSVIPGDDDISDEICPSENSGILVHGEMIHLLLICALLTLRYI